MTPGTPIHSENAAPRLDAPVRAFLALTVFYICFLGMEAVHEMGHVLAALASGGRVVSVDIPLIGTSQTRVAPNPAELIVLIGGPLGGIVIPLLACMLARLSDRPLPEPLKFFTGFCLIANGVYMGVGSLWRNTDAGELIARGAPQASLILFGIACTAAGLLVWHRLPWFTTARE